MASLGDRLGSYPIRDKRGGRVRLQISTLGASKEAGGINAIVLLARGAKAPTKS
jgi:hypothetical protein